MPLVELSRQHQAFPIFRHGLDRVAALHFEVAEIVEIDGNAECVSDAPADLEGFLAQDRAPGVFAPVVIGSAEVAENDAALPLVANSTGDGQRLFLIRDGSVMISLAFGDETQIIQAAGDAGAVLQLPEPFQRLGKERGRSFELALVTGQNPELAQGAGFDYAITQLL